MYLLTSGTKTKQYVKLYACYEKNLPRDYAVAKPNRGKRICFYIK